MEVIDQGFDREFTLAELLNGVNLAALTESLKCMMGGAVRLISMQGEELAASDAGVDFLNRVEIHYELDSVGYLEAETADRQRLEAAAHLLEMLLRINARFHMALQLHYDVVRDDYEVLQRKHDELAVSEARYKALAENLEQRVQARTRELQETQAQLVTTARRAGRAEVANNVLHNVGNVLNSINVSAKVNLVALGLFAWVLTVLIPQLK